MSNLTYPHTSILATLGNLSQSSDPAVAALAAKALGEYRAKKTFYTARIAELEAQVAESSDDEDEDVDDDEVDTQSVRDLPGYPHTSILDNLDKLIGSLSHSTSPEKARRLELAREIQREYLVKKEFLFTALAERL